MNKDDGITKVEPRLEIKEKHSALQGKVKTVEDDIRRIHTDVVNSALKWGQVLKDYSSKKRNIMESLDAIEAKERKALSLRKEDTNQENVNWTEIT
uniref:Uncharacterized protein n=1 Tax=Timema bartmani TaxID=61472 RepID=A0A7R9F6Y7_9NEOP|nr:unnamed protein product [Timema bartmani]